MIEETTPLREPVKGMLIAGWLCCDCQSCDKHGTCHVFRCYVGLWSRKCGRFRKRDNRRGAER